jgi:DNA-binding PadR family transcriptional regulator
MTAIGGDKLRGHLEMLILATLERGEAHGLEILRRLEAGGCGLLHLKEGSLYPALYRLEEAGEVVAVWEKETHGRRGPRGRIYRLTRQGHRKLAQGRDEWQKFVATIGGILLNAPA